VEDVQDVQSNLHRLIVCVHCSCFFARRRLVHTACGQCTLPEYHMVEGLQSICENELGHRSKAEAPRQRGGHHRACCAFAN
jgi:hypothetical protein